MQMRARNSGFTLVELMVVVLVGAILVAVGVSGYSSQVRKARRTEAKTALLDLATREAKYLTLNNAYTALPAQLGYGGAAFPITIGNGFYQVYVCPGAAAGTSSPNTPCIGTTAAPGTSFVVAAIPLATSAQANDVQCQYFAVDNTGAQFGSSSATGTGPDTTAACWQ
jgi:type IV pilus assembly protein PilE